MCSENIQFLFVFLNKVIDFFYSVIFLNIDVCIFIELKILTNRDIDDRKS